MTKPDFEALALEWLVRATGHVPKGREQSLAVELQKAYEMGLAASLERIVAAPELLPEGVTVRVDTVCVCQMGYRAGRPVGLRVSPGCQIHGEKEPDTEPFFRSDAEVANYSNVAGTTLTIDGLGAAAAEIRALPNRAPHLGTGDPVPPGRCGTCRERPVEPGNALGICAACMAR